MIESLLGFRHLFKLDPDRPLADGVLARVCRSGTDGVIVGGSSGITYDNTAGLLRRIRRFDVPCVLEVSDPDAVVPGFDAYLIPMVLNAGDTRWLVGQHQRALKRYGAHMPWEMVAAEGYIILNGDCAAARMTEARSDLDGEDVLAYARLADRLLRLPIVYLEYSGRFGDMELVRRVKRALGGARLFYGGGIDGAERARLAAEAADTVIVGNIIYEDPERALETVQAVRNPLRSSFKQEG